MATHRASTSSRRRVSDSGNLRRAFGLIGGSVVWPGSAQFVAGNRTLGALAMTLWAAGVTAVLSIWWFFRPSRDMVFDAATSSETLRWFQIGLIVGALVWLALLVDAWRLALAPRMRWGSVAVVSIVNLLIVALVTSLTTVGWNTLSASREVLTTVFKAKDKSSPLKGRYNVLLIGSDSGKGRMGYRTDSMTIASIDASTGKTVLISLPRSLQGAVFKPGSPMLKYYPDGFRCPDHSCLLNAVHTTVDSLGTEVAKKLYPGSSDPGLAATIDAIEGTTGLTINYHILINMNGLAKLVNSVGGVRLTVKGKIPMFSAEEAWKYQNDPDMYVPQGTHVLGGREALWFGRSRFLQSDYVRMARQKCLMNAMVHQLSPQKVLLNAGKIADASSTMLQTDIPASDLSAFAELSLKSRTLPIASLGIVPPKYNTVNPDIDQIHRDIAALIDKSEATAKPKPATTATTTTPTPTQTTATPDGKSNSTAASDTDDLNSVC